MTSLDQATDINKIVLPDSASNSPKSGQEKLQEVVSSEQSTQADSQGLKEQSRKLSKKAKKRKPQIILNVSDTKYEIVRYVGKKVFQWRLSNDPHGDWDIFWTDCAVNPETLAKMHPYQKINHFPGMYSLARKNHLGKHLMRMKKAFPEEYKFFPTTYLLPTEYSEFRSQFANNKIKTYIVKPEASCQGRGIFLTRTCDSVHQGEHYVVQKYLTKPFLIDGLKFDLRVYALLVGCDPLRIYVFNDGLARFATEQYDAPSGKNLDNMCMHLTNYAINKGSPNFVFNTSEQNDNEGHKRSLKAVFKTLESLGHNVEQLWTEIKQLIIKTFISVQPILAHNYRACQADDYSNNMCFEILGFDVILDRKLKPHLLEVNHTPSFTTDTPLDRNIKKNVIKDALKLLNIALETKLKYKKKKRIELRKRILTGKTIKVTSEERQAEITKAQKERDDWELQNLGGYQRVYPFTDPSEAYEDYERLLKESKNWWEEWTGTANRRTSKRLLTEANTKLRVIGSSPTNRQEKNQDNNQNKSTQNLFSLNLKRHASSSARPSCNENGFSVRAEDTFNSNKEVNRSLNMISEGNCGNSINENSEIDDPRDDEERKLVWRRVSCEMFDENRNYDSITEEDLEDSDHECVAEDADPEEENQNQIDQIISIKEDGYRPTFENNHVRNIQRVRRDIQEVGGERSVRTVSLSSPLLDKKQEFQMKGAFKIKSNQPQFKDQGSKTLSSGLSQVIGNSLLKTMTANADYHSPSETQPPKNYLSFLGTEGKVPIQPPRITQIETAKKTTSIVDELLQLSQKTNSFYTNLSIKADTNRQDQRSSDGSNSMRSFLARQRVTVRSTPRANPTVAMIQKPFVQFGNYMASKAVKVNVLETNETKNDLILSLGIQGIKNVSKSTNGLQEPQNKHLPLNIIHAKEKGIVTRPSTHHLLTRRK